MLAMKNAITPVPHSLVTGEDISLFSLAPIVTFCVVVLKTGTLRMLFATFLSPHKPAAGSITIASVKKNRKIGFKSCLCYKRIIRSLVEEIRGSLGDGMERTETTKSNEGKGRPKPIGVGGRGAAFTRLAIQCSWVTYSSLLTYGLTSSCSRIQVLPCFA